MVFLRTPGRPDAWRPGIYISCSDDFLWLNELTVRCDELLKFTMTLLRALDICEVLLAVCLRSVIRFIDGERVETQTSWNICVS